MSICRIHLCGAHSTGKTTLLHTLAPLLNIRAYTNVARDVLQQASFDRNSIDPFKDKNKFKDFQIMVIERLLEIDKENAENGQDYMIDRGIDPLVYADMYLGEETRKLLQQHSVVQEFVSRLRKSMVFVLQPHPECVKDDGVRMHPEMTELHLFTDKMLSILKELMIPYKVIGVLDMQLRQKQVITEILKIKSDLVKNQ